MSGAKKPLTFDIDAAPAPIVAPAKRGAPGPKAFTEAARKQVGARIRVDTYREMKLRATMQDKTIGELVEQAIAEYLANHPA